jgi:hypothetical protein
MSNVAFWPDAVSPGIFPLALIVGDWGKLVCQLFSTNFRMEAVYFVLVEDFGGGLGF